MSEPVGNSQSSEPAHTSPDHRSALPRRTRSGTTTASSIAMGLLTTIVFYLIARRIPGSEQFVQRYFCGHPVEYVATTMFMTGGVILIRKFRALFSERKALTDIQLLTETQESHPSALQRSVITECLQKWMADAAPRTTRTVLFRRIEDTLHYVRGRQESSLEEHLRYLADLATDRLHQSFALMRTISWAIPILGFLGTVMGITIAIANVTPEQLDSSLPEVTGGLAIAFDTTAQALAMSMLLVFGSFLVERGEQSILNDVEQFGIDCLLTWFQDTAPIATQPTVQSELSEWTMRLLQQQTTSWGAHLQELQSGWSNALASQTEQLSAALDQETQSTLQLHRHSLDDARDSWEAVLQHSTQLFATQMQQSMDAFGARIELWQDALRTSSLASAQQAEELHRLGRTLLRLTESEERLAQLQQQLNDNLQALQIVDTLEQTVNSLNAAVHVLTAKTHVRAAA